MIVNSHVNIELEWKYLPWLQINKRIALMQKKIFDASREYDLNKVYQAQNIFINSFEARVFAIEIIIKDINKYYSYERYLCNDTDKFHIFKYLFNHNSKLKAKLKILAEQIREYLIYLLLEPEWKTRFILLNFKYLEDKHCQDIDNIENLNWQKLVSNNKLLSYISKSIRYWSINKCYVQTYYYKFNYLPILLLDILKVRLNWSRLKINKLKYNSDYASIDAKQGTSILNNSLNNIFTNTKSKFYYQSSLKKIKFKQELNWEIITNEINLIIQNELCNNIKKLKYDFIKNIISKVNALLSLLKIKKKYHHFIYLLNYHKSNIYNILYKKIISNYLFQYLFQINR